MRERDTEVASLTPKGRGRVSSRLGLAVLLALSFLALAAAPAGAKQTHLFLEEFEVPTKPFPFASFNAVRSLAIDQATGDLLVVDGRVETVSRWHADGTPADFPALGSNVIDAAGGGECPTVPADCDQTPENGFYFDNIGRSNMMIAVDNSGTATDGNIYVAQGGDGIDQAVYVFASSGKYLGRISGPGSSEFGTGYGICGVTVDPTGNLFVASAPANAIFKFDPSSNPPVNGDHVATFTTVNEPCGLAAGVGPTAGFLFVGQSFQGGMTVKIDSVSGALKYAITTRPESEQQVAVNPADGHLYVNTVQDTEMKEYDASGAAGAALVSSSDTEDTGYRAIAVNAATGDVYLGFEYGVPGGKVDVYGPLVTVPDVTTGAATITGDTSVTLNGTVNPDGVPIEECLFEYELAEAYDQTGTYGHTVPCTESNGEIGSGLSPKAVHADLPGLASESLYHMRLVAKNANAAIRGEDQTFKTPSKPELKREWAASVGTIEAALRATINPGNSATTFLVEWGTDASYGQSTAALSVGSDDADHTVGVSLGGLLPATTYHWRVVATNSIGEVIGPDRTFRTYPEGPLVLPDGRAHEMASPLAKEGGDVALPGPAGGVAAFSVLPLQASPGGDAIAYGSFTAFGDDPESSPAASEYLSRFGAGGWSTDNINPRFEEGYLRDPVVGFSEDLSHAALNVFEPELTADAAIDVPNLYWRDNASGELQAITTEAHHPQSSLSATRAYCLFYGGSAADSERVVFGANRALLPGDPSGDGFNLYEWSPEAGLALVSVLPEGAAAAPSYQSSFGYGYFAASFFDCVPNAVPMRHAISADGSRIFWTYGGNIGTAKSPLLARINGAETIRLDAPNEGVAGKGGEGQYWDASVDGSKVFFTTQKKLTATPTTAGSSDLYLYDFSAPLGERLTDLTARVGEAAGVQGVIGASADGSFVYFAATGVLTGEEENAHHEKAQPGESNVYAWHRGEGLRYIATGAAASNWVVGPDSQTGRVSPDGSAVAFLSNESLTGFDSAIDGEHCQPGGEDGHGGEVPIGPPECNEAFLYDYDEDTLSCASCNAAGTAPLGRAGLPTWSTPYSQPRYLSDSGNRLFFTTFDALDPHDENGKQDVYEFERAESGTCDQQSPHFNPIANGCTYLISGGASSDASYLLDASADGDDVFFSTREGLVFSDDDGHYDVYDARVGGSSPQPQPPECEGEGCREADTSPLPASAGGTTSFQGPGDPAPKRGCPKGRREVKQRGKSRCVKTSKRHKRAKQNRRKSR